MKLVSGRSLDRVIAETHDASERLSLLPRLIAVVEAMAYAHDRRVIHRDLKPANVVCRIVRRDGGDRLGARQGPRSTERNPARDLASEGLTVAGAVVGTPAYMPPEQARGEPVDERADVYALGAMLYHLLAGRPPFSGRDPTQVLRAVLSGSPQPLEALEPETPPDLVAIVRKAMSAEASERYPTAKELAEDLRRFEAGRLVGAHRYTGGELLRRFARRQRVPLVMGSMALLILAVSGGFAVSRIARSAGGRHGRRAAEERGDELV